MSDEAHAAAEEKVADLIFGPDPTKEEPVVDTPVDDSEDETPDPVDDAPDPDAPDGDEYEPDPKPVEEGEESMVEFEWDGQVIEAPQNIKDALMRNKDYTEKTQEVSASRKELEIKIESVNLTDSQYKFAQSVQEHVLRAHQLEQQIEAARVYMRENIDTMTHTDLEKIRMAIDETRQDRDKIINDVTTKNTEFQQAREQSLTELAVKSTEVLRQKVPGWDDSHEGKIKDYALSLGIPEQTYASVVDPTEKLILHKAMLYDALKAGVTPAVKTVQNAPSIKAKSRNPMSKDKQDELNLRKKIKNPNRSTQQKAVDIGLDIANRMKL